MRAYSIYVPVQLAHVGCQYLKKGSGREVLLFNLYIVQIVQTATAWTRKEQRSCHHLLLFLCNCHSMSLRPANGGTESACCTYTSINTLEQSGRIEKTTLRRSSKHLQEYKRRKNKVEVGIVCNKLQMDLTFLSLTCRSTCFGHSFHEFIIMYTLSISLFYLLVHHYVGMSTGTLPRSTGKW